MSGFKANNQSGPQVHRAAADELSEAQVYRSKALEYAQLAKQASTPRVREHLLRMGQSCLLIAKNAEWLESTDAFLREWRNH
jgi:hypothetical protein